MKRKNMTRNALFTSIISLLLCVSMLVGTTFAWFTDTVESGRNVIAAGNLDVEVYTATGASVNGNTELFKVDHELWEPGALAYETLTVKNEGSLALKYKMDLTVLSETVVNGYKLSDVIKVGVVDPEKADFTSRETLIKSITNWTPMSSFSLDKANVKLDKGESDSVCIALYWQPNSNEIDNRYNMNNENKGKELKLEIGLNVYATQIEHESDSFDSTYDAEATLSTTVSTNARTDGSASLTTLNAPAANTKKTVVEAPAGTFEEGKKVEMTMTSSNTLFNITNNGAVVGTLNIELSVDGAVQHKTIDGYYKVTTYISKGLNAVKVEYTGTDGLDHPKEISYDPETGMLVFYTNHFSEYAVSGSAYGYAKDADVAYSSIDAVIDAMAEEEQEIIVPDVHKVEVFGAAAGNPEVQEQLSSATVNGVPYLTAKEAFTAANEGQTVKLKAGTYKFADISLKPGITVEGTEGVLFTDTLRGNLENIIIKNVEITASNAQRWAYAKGNLLFENCIFNATGIYAIHYDGLTNANITYKGCDITGWVAIGGGADHITFEDCDINGNGTYGLIRLYSPGTIKNCKFDVANVNTTDVYQDGIHAVDAKVEVVNCTNVNGDVTELCNISGTGMLIVDGKALVTSADALEAALKEQVEVVMADNLSFSAKDTAANSGYGATGVKVEGGVFDGNNKTLTVKDAWSTWDCAVNVTAGTIKNLTINSAMRGIFMGGATGDIYIDNVTIDGTIYTFNSDGGNKNYGVYISNSTLNGWTSHSDVHKEVVYTNCEFGEGNGYAFCRPYGPTSFVGCNFSEGYEMDCIGAVTFENCTIGDVALTAENLATLVTSNTANATVK